MLNCSINEGMVITLSNGTVLGERPLVAGVICSLGTLDQVAKAENLPPCDLVELRLGEIELANDTWLKLAKVVRDRGLPVLITVRNDAEGGTWRDDDPERMNLFNIGLCDFSLVDVELNSRQLYRVIQHAQELGKPVIVSCHDFETTPGIRMINSLADRVAGFDSVIFKIATKANCRDDIQVLESFIQQDLPFPVCVLAMGEMWRETRVTFPLLGSCLTYGYLDKPSAPGQHSCAELMQLLKSAQG